MSRDLPADNSIKQPAISNGNSPGSAVLGPQTHSFELFEPISDPGNRSPRNPKIFLKLLDLMVRIAKVTARDLFNDRPLKATVVF
jgi:hypothetical protein